MDNELQQSALAHFQVGEAELSTINATLEVRGLMGSYEWVCRKHEFALVVVVSDRGVAVGAECVSNSAWGGGNWTRQTVSKALDIGLTLLT
ncbi:hypothetical protein OAH22_01365 [bacterium]|nr:hypothetical protein [bacterium]MDC0288082.1 hypothetical protein [Rubripirellula sp.]